ncbi:MAG: ABC transporter ATP-binding protein [Candidatus Methanodesulfokora sp.]
MLSVENLRKFFGGIRAVDGVNINCEQGKITLIIGPNGSGKTTLINLITGYYKPDSGKVYFKGEEITGLPMNKIYERGIVRSFQIPSLFWGMTVLENILTAARGNPGESILGGLIRSKWIDYERGIVKKAFSIMKSLGLADFWDFPVEKLPAGHLKLVEIGRALMAEANMIILDEPISGVSPKLAREIFLYIKGLRDSRGLTFLIIEHRLDIALPFADHVYVMHEGRIIFDGAPGEVVKNNRVREVYLGGERDELGHTS